jgi:hypothetical protein
MQEMLYQIMFIFGASVCKVYVDTVNSHETIHRLWERSGRFMACIVPQAKFSARATMGIKTTVQHSHPSSRVLFFVAASLLVFVIVQAAFLL